MSGFITYFPKEQVKALEKAGDKGPISVIFGSIHTKMPSIKSVKVGDIIYPITLTDGTINVLARLPVEEIEVAYDYCVRELGNSFGSLTPEGKDWHDFYDTPPFPHKKHQEPFNCCSQLAATSQNGSTIKLRPMKKELMPVLRFGRKGKEIPLRFDKNGGVAIVSVSSVVRRMSEETQKIFEEVFQSKPTENDMYKISETKNHYLM